MPESYFTGPLPGTVYYGYLTSKRTYWALAHFSLTPAASERASVDMQDGGDFGIFMRRNGEPWKMTPGGFPFPCPGVLPTAVMAIWGMTSPGQCVVASKSSPARSKLINPTTSIVNPPAGTYFGTIVYFDLDLEGNGTILLATETWQGASSPVSDSGGGWIDLAIVPSTTTGYWVGNRRDSSHEVTGHFDSHFAGIVADAMKPFTAQPYSGYVIQTAVIPGCTGSCAEASSVTQVNSVTPIPTNPDYTEPDYTNPSS
jgi:hypothetical protein